MRSEQEVTHTGAARDSRDIAGALALAACTFAPASGSASDPDAKRIGLWPRGQAAAEDVIVLASGSEIVGACFLVDRDFYGRAAPVRGTFLSAICMAKSMRGRGLSRILMQEAIAACWRRGAAFSVLIARRAVDHYYTKFSFWGLSEYSTLSFALPPTNAASSECSLEPAAAADLPAIAALYDATYGGLHGPCIRGSEHWRHALWKAERLHRRFVVCRHSGRIGGYAVLVGNVIHELAAGPVPYLAMLGALGNAFSFDQVTCRAAAAHPVVRELRNLDFSISRRQCSYGGHMVRVIRPELLPANLGPEVCAVAGDGQVASYGHEDTCRLMEVPCLSDAALPLAGASRPFNVLLLDEV